MPYMHIQRAQGQPYLYLRWYADGKKQNKCLGVIFATAAPLLDTVIRNSHKLTVDQLIMVRDANKFHRSIV